MRERKANCFEGALFAAAALRFHGRRPLLVDMRSHNDDDHVLAVFRENGAWGCVAKSNFTVLRFREPVYRTIRELMMSLLRRLLQLHRREDAARRTPSPSIFRASTPRAG